MDTVKGVVRRTSKGLYVLRDPDRSFRPAGAGRDVIVTADVMRRNSLCEGAMVEGTVRSDRGSTLLDTVQSVFGLTVERFRARRLFVDLTPIPPCERFNLEASGELAMRMVDLVAPIGKGTRGLIVSPPKAGKTTMLGQIANAIRKDQPDCEVIVLLIDERPEEVTMFRRSVDAKVVASSIDQTIDEHVELAETLLAYIHVAIECGRDVVVLVDSLTRMGRAFNRKGSGSGRIMSGGLEAGVLEIPRRFLGLARKIENGGSVTIIATALIDTGSKMDQLIFEEFKGTGNSEIVLSRSLAEQGVYPAIDIPKSGTRMDDQLWGKSNSDKISNLRRLLAERHPAEAHETIRKIFGKYHTNAELLKILPG